MTDTQTGPDGPKVISENKAKQGRRGLHVLLILIVSATLAALVLFFVWMTRSADLATAPTNTEAADVAGVNQDVAGARQEALPGEGS